MTRLLLLWLLAERALTGYEIKRGLTDAGMRFWFTVEDASIYSVLRTLLRNGHVVEEAVERTDTRRPRTRYAITPEGRAHYRGLLRQALADPHPFAAPVEVALAAGGDLDPGEVVSCLSLRAEALRGLIAEQERHAPSSPSVPLVGRRRALARAELAWVEELLANPIR